MKLLQYILPPLALLGTLTACRDYDGSYQDYVSGSSDSLYVEMTFDVAGSTVTRAVPNGGEEGDGWEYGREYENQLHNFTVFVLGGGNGVNAAANTPFFGSRYFSDEEVARIDSIREENLRLKPYDVLKDVLTYTFSIPIIASRDEINPKIFRFIVVANNGDLTSYQTLGALRDGIPQRTWTAPTADTPNPTRFVMSNENDQYYETGSGAFDDPYRLHVSIERMAARIDYYPTGTEITSDGIRYPLNNTKDGVTTTLAFLYLDRMAIVNGSQKPSYYIKRVADDINGTNVVYLGDETPTPRGIATNYVIDPYSVQKTVANREALPATLFGDSRISNVAALLATDASKVPTIENTKSPVILGYVNENTYAADMACAEYSTGVALQCRYAPQKNYYTAYDPEQDGTLMETTDGVSAVSDGLTPGTYELGTTFYLVEYNQKGIDETQRLYFKNKTDAEAYATNTAKGRFGKVTEYVGGVCYYFIYMRHSNNVEVVHDKMEYGIVRNNIYRFTLQSASGPGTPTPDYRGPEEMKARIYVKKWIAVEHPIIYV